MRCQAAGQTRRSGNQRLEHPQRRRRPLGFFAIPPAMEDRVEEAKG
jgi:hypothetical protein